MNDTNNSAVFFEGASQLNGVQIVGILSGLRRATKNAKTGDLLQAWILVAHKSPSDAIATGEDAAICGDCSLRGEGIHGRACYVTYWQGPTKVWGTLDRLPRLTPLRLGRQIEGRRVRLGAYGDPVAIPAPTWRSLLRLTAGAIGYTQQWKTCDDRYRQFLMASVLSTVDRDDARARGWRTYRVRGPKDTIDEGECICPASHEAEQVATCDACMLCSGAQHQRANPVIMAHGKPGNLRAFGVPMTLHRRPQ